MTWWTDIIGAAREHQACERLSRRSPKPCHGVWPDAPGRWCAGCTIAVLIEELEDKSRRRLPRKGMHRIKASRIAITPQLRGPFALPPQNLGQLQQRLSDMADECEARAVEWGAETYRWWARDVRAAETAILAMRRRLPEIA